MVASNCQGVIINCEFRMMNWGFLGNSYNCLSRGENTGNLTLADEVRGEHLSGKSNADVEVFNEQGNKIQFIPSNLADFFPNINGMLIGAAPLLELTANDLKPFPNLLRFDSNYGEFSSIDGDLFQHTKMIQKIQINNARLQNVGENLLSGLNDLTNVEFRGDACINFFADTLEKIEELKDLLLVQCPPLPGPTATVSTTTEDSADQCPLRCSLEKEVDELNWKVDVQDEIIADLRENNTRQDEEIMELRESNADMLDRLMELEKKLREIGLNP